MSTIVKGTMKSSSSYSIEDLKADTEGEYTAQPIHNGQVGTGTCHVISVAHKIVCKLVNNASRDPHTDAQLLSNGLESKYTNVSRFVCVVVLIK